MAVPSPSLAAMSVAKPSAAPPTPPIGGCLERRSSDHIGGVYAPWIPAGVHMPHARIALPGVPSSPPPYYAIARPHFGIPSTPRSDAPGLPAALPGDPSSRARPPRGHLGFFKIIFVIFYINVLGWLVGWLGCLVGWLVGWLVRC